MRASAQNIRPVIKRLAKAARAAWARGVDRVREVDWARGMGRVREVDWARGVDRVREVDWARGVGRMREAIWARAVEFWGWARGALAERFGAAAGETARETAGATAVATAGAAAEVGRDAANGLEIGLESGPEVGPEIAVERRQGAGFGSGFGSGFGAGSGFGSGFGSGARAGVTSLMRSERGAAVFGAWRASFAAPVRAMLLSLRDTARDLAPILIVVGVFQVLVLRQPVDNIGDIALGFVFVLIGLAVFIRGLEMALFPLGEALANALALRGSLVLLIIFAFGLGFGTTVAEPALIAVADEAAAVMAAGGMIGAGEAVQAGIAQALRYTVAVSVGVSLVIGVFRILMGWPVHWLIMAGYVLVVALTAVAPAEIIGIAYDSGGVTTSTITVPLVTALGVGLASVIKGRNPMVDGFGLIAFASLMPIIFVLIFGVVVAA